MFRASDKFEVTTKLRQSGFDPAKDLFENNVNQVQQIVQALNLVPGNDEAAVDRLVAGENRFYRLYKDGRTEEVNKQTFDSEILYNFVPERFKTYNPNKKIQ